MLNKFSKPTSDPRDVEINLLKDRLNTALAQRDHWRRENLSNLEHLELLEREFVGCREDGQRLSFLATSLSSIHCNWTSPGDWTVTTYDMHAMEDGTFTANTLREAIDKARLQRG